MSKLNVSKASIDHEKSKEIQKLKSYARNMGHTYYASVGKTPDDFEYERDVFFKIYEPMLVNLSEVEFENIFSEDEFKRVYLEGVQQRKNNTMEK